MVQLGWYISVRLMCIVTDSGGSLFTNTWLADIHQPYDDDDDDDGDDDD